MMKLLFNLHFIVLAVVLAMPLKTKAQEINVNIGFRDSLKSEILQENRKIMIHLPEGYEESNKKYPVLYCLDGSELNLVFAVSAAHRLTYWDEVTPEMIIVAIENTNRARDMWPANGDYYPKEYKAGASDFIKFIEKELIPFVDSKFRVSEKRILYGQSLSAMFTSYAFITKPELFDAYILSSGAFPGCEEYFKDLYKKSFVNKDKYANRSIFITNGTHDPLDAEGIMHKQMVDFTKAIQSDLNEEVKVKYKTYENEGHVPFHSLYDGLKFIFEPTEN